MEANLMLHLNGWNQLARMMKIHLDFYQKPESNWIIILFMGIIWMR